MITFSVTFGWQSHAHAEDKAKAMTLLEAGQKILDRGDRLMLQNKPGKAQEAFAEALVLYKKAYKAFKSPKIFFPIAQAEQRLGDPMAAMGHYQAMLNESKNPSADLVAKVDKAIAEVRRELVVLDLTVEQDGAEVQVDGETIGTTPLDGPHYMTPGEHRYIVTLEGHEPAEETFDLNPGKKVTRHLVLDSMTTAQVKKKRTTTTVKGPTPVSTGASAKPLTIGFGLAGLMFVGAGFTAIAAKARHDRYEDESLSVEERTRSQDKGKTYQLATDLLLGGGILAAGYGVYYYYSTYKDSSEKQATSLHIAPYATGKEVGVALGATF